MDEAALDVEEQLQAAGALTWTVAALWCAAARAECLLAQTGRGMARVHATVQQLRAGVDRVGVSAAKLLGPERLAGAVQNLSCARQFEC